MKVRAAEKNIPYPYWLRDRRTRASRVLEMEYGRIVDALGGALTGTQKRVAEEIARLTVALNADEAMDPFVRARVISTIDRLQRKLGIGVGPKGPARTDHRSAALLDAARSSTR